MKPISCLLITRGIGFLIVLTSFSACKKDVITQPPLPPSGELKVNSEINNLVVTGLSQIKTATILNDWPRAYVNPFKRFGAQTVAFDDNIYAFTKKFTSTTPNATLELQGFGFSIPSNATIENIQVSVRRFKKGTASIKDNVAFLIKSPDLPGILSQEFGVIWRYPDNYPATEAEFIYAQTGTGNNAGIDEDQFYLWTPDLINNPKFGVRIYVSEPTGGGFVAVYYDQVQIAVEYSMP